MRLGLRKVPNGDKIQIQLCRIPIWLNKDLRQTIQKRTFTQIENTKLFILMKNEFDLFMMLVLLIQFKKKNFGIFWAGIFRKIEKLE